MLARGWGVGEYGRPRLGDNLQGSINESFEAANLFVVLVPIAGANSHVQRAEIGQILERAWQDADARVAVVAPAVGAIPPALRNRKFVTYYSHEDAGLEKWPSSPTAVDGFLDLLLQPRADGDKQLGGEAEAMRQWRNRLVHLGRAPVDEIPTEDRQTVLESLRQELEFGSSAAAVVQDGNLEHLLNRILLSEALGDRELAERFYRLIRADTGGNDFLPTAESADAEYSRALAAYEVAAFDEARTAFERAAEINRTVRGDSDPRTIASMHNAALAAARSGDVGRAEVLYRSALASAEQGLGPHHPQTAGIAYSLALINAANGDVPEAIRLFRMAEDAYRRVTPPDSPELAAVTRELERLTS